MKRSAHETVPYPLLFGYLRCHQTGGRLAGGLPSRLPSLDRTAQLKVKIRR